MIERTQIVKVVVDPDGSALIHDRKRRKSSRQYLSQRHRAMLGERETAHFTGRHDGKIWWLDERVADQQW